MDGHGLVYGVVHRVGVLHKHSSVGEIIVPGQHGELSFPLIEIVVVDAHAGIAVGVYQKIVGGKIADDLVGVESGFKVFPVIEPLYGGDEALFILVGG